MTNRPKTSQIHGLAIAFARVLRTWLTAEQMATVVETNRLRADGDLTCASHDFCDANMAMLEAYKKLFQEFPAFPSDVESGDATETDEANDTALMNAAWSQAKRLEFNVERLTEDGDRAVLAEATSIALDVAAREIQDYLGVKFGDYAGMFFSGSTADGFTSLLNDYLKAERALIASEEDETPPAPQDKASKPDHFTEILQHRIRWHLEADGAPTELPEGEVDRLEKMIREGYNQGELNVYVSETDTEFYGWWSIDKS